MSNYGSQQFGFFFLGGYEMHSLPLKEVVENVEAVLDDLMALGDTWARPVAAGTAKATLDIKGLYDDGAVFDGQMLQIGASVKVCYNLEGNAAGKHLVDFNSMVLQKYSRLPVKDKLHRSELTLAKSNNLVNVSAQILVPYETDVASSGAGSSVDRNTTETEQTTFPITGSTKANPCVITSSVPHGLVSGQVVSITSNTLAGPSINGESTVTVISATTFSLNGINTSGSSGTGNDGSFVINSTVNGGVAILHVTGLTLGGYTNFDPYIQHSTDGASWATLYDFSAVGNVTVVGGYRQSVAAGTTVRRYLRGAWLYNGAGAGQSVTWMIGFARN